MRKITILEGPDGAGKTTLAKTFENREYLHYGPPPAYKHGAWTQYMTMLKDLWKDPHGPDVVIDRFIYGELVYGPVLRGKTDLTWAHIRMLERVLLGMDAELIICLPPWEVVLANWERNRANELLKTADKLLTVYKFYEALYIMSDLPKAQYSYVGDDSLVPSQAPLLPNKGPGIGVYFPGFSTLLVGDMVNKRTGHEGWPFVSAFGCSPWLAQELIRAGISEKSLYWVNSATEHGTTDARFVVDLRPARIIALGKKAADWCKANALAHVTVMHPQAWKRFHSDDLYPLIPLLRNET